MSRGRVRALALAAVVLASAFVVGVGPVAAGAGDVDPAASGVTVSFEPTNRTASAGANVTYDVVVDGATEGVGSYQFDVDAVGSAAVVGASLNGNPGVSDVSVGANGSTLRVSAAVLSDTSVTRLATVTVQGTSTGAGTLSLSDVQVGNADGSTDYAVSTGGDAALSVEGSTGPVVNVTSVSGPSSATAGDVVDVNVTVRNVGGSAVSAANVSARLDADGDGVLAPDEAQSSTAVALDAGESTTVRLRLDTSGLSSGTYAYGAVTADDEGRAELTVGAATGYVAGVVTDESGAAVANADVSVSAGGYARTVENATGTDGRYRLEVPAYGTSEPYTVTVRADGYSSARMEGVTVAADETATVDATLTALSGPVVAFGSDEVSAVPGEERTVRVLAEGASDGVAGFEFVVNATGPVSVLDVEPALSGAIERVSVAEDGSGARVQFLAQSDADVGHVATVTLVGNATGDGALSLSNVSLQSTEGSYDVAAGADATVSVASSGTSLGSGLLVGTVTDSAGTALPGSAVYASTVRLGDETRVTLSPLDNDGDGTTGDADDVDDPSDEFAVALQRADASGSFSTVATATVDAATLGGYSFGSFTGLSVNTSTTYRLYDVANASGGYTLVTPTAGTNATVEATAVGLSSAVRDATGTAAATVAAGGTATADVALATDDGGSGGSPGDGNTSTGTTARVLLAGAPDGLGAYNVSVGTPGTTATLASVEGRSDATLAQVESGGAGEASVTYRALFQSFDATSENVTLLTVELSDPAARDDLSLSVASLQDGNGTPIDRSRVSLVLETSGGGADGVSFAGSPLEGSANVDDDPFPEDVDGNGVVNLDDVFVFGFDAAFNQGAYTQAQLDALDYDGDGDVDLDDVFQFAFSEALA